MVNISRRAWERQLKTALSKMGTGWLTANLMEWFDFIEQCPSPDQFVKMCSATRFGGRDNSMVLGGKDFLLAATIKNLKNAARKGVLDRAKVLQGDQMCYTIRTAYNNVAANVVSRIDIDNQLLDFVNLIEFDDFETSNFSDLLYIDKSTKSFGILVIPFAPFDNAHPDYNLLSLLDEGERDYSWNKDDGLSFGTFESGPMKQTSRIDVTFSSIDRLLAICPDRPRHKVKAHKRHYKSGVVSNIDEFERTNRLTKEAIKNEITDHVV